MTELILFLANKLIWIVILVAFVGLALNYRKTFALALVSGFLAYLVGKFIKDFWYLPRPLGAGIMDGSFPSNHTSLAFGIAFSIFLKHRRLGLIMLILAILVGVGRILSGVHFTVDVVGGVILGVGVAWLLDTYHSK